MALIQLLRKYKIFGMAGFDLITTIIVSYILGQKMNSQGILFTVLSIPVSISFFIDIFVISLTLQFKYSRFGKGGN